MEHARPISRDERIQRVVYFFETLTEPRLDALHEIYAADARFIDPFNDVAVFRHRSEVIRAHL